jgi:elongation factor G
MPVIYTAAASNIAVHALMDLAGWALPNPTERPLPVALDEEGEEVEISIGPDAPFSAQVIHTFIDEFSGKLAIFRIFGGTPPSDGIVQNTVSGQQERLGTLYNLRGNQRTPVEPVCGDIVSVAKLKHTHTNDTLVMPDETWRFQSIKYPPPMMSYTIRATSKGGDDKIKQAVERLCEEDPTISISYDELSHQLVLNGMGQAHLDMAVARMKRKSKVTVSTNLPLVPYRETLKRKVIRVEGKHKKQTGGAGQFGVCYLDVEPLPSGSGFEFVDKIFGGSIPRQFVPSIEKGLSKCMVHGGLAGYPVVDIRVTLVDGKYHPVDSKDVAFQMAGSKGLKAAMAEAGMKLLEPVYKMEIVTPTENMGDVMGDITSRRGRVMGMNQRSKNTVIEASVPLGEIQRYAPDLRSMTGGKGTYTMVFESYEDVPGNMIDKVVSSSPFRQSGADD